MSGPSEGSGVDLTHLSNVASFNRFGFSLTELRGLIRQYGSAGELRRALPCTCVSVESNTPAADCEHCGGQGHTYPPHLRERTRVLESGRNPKTTRNAPGDMTAGTLQVTMCDCAMPAEGDLWLPDGETRVVRQRLWFRASREAHPSSARTSSRYDFLSAPLAERRSYEAEVLLHDHVENHDVEAVVWLDESRNRVIGVVGVDLDVRAGGRIEWRKGGRTPPRGRPYAIRYRVPRAYMVGESAPVFRIAHQRRLPWRVTMHRIDKVQKNDVPLEG